MRTLLTIAVFISTFLAKATEPEKTNWIHFPDDRFQINGLPWFQENTPELWRLPKTAKEKVPTGVWSRAVAPDGGRIRFASDTSQLRLKVHVSDKSKKPSFFDAYVGDKLAGSAKASGTEETELLLFENAGHSSEDITIYLPNNHEAQVVAVGVDKTATVKKPKSFGSTKPFIFYGSSVLQGTGASHPSKTYPAILARRLGVDFVNLGFGGAGKAEPVVVDLVNQLDASCYIFDLGKSYGDQGNEPYARMLGAIRAKHATIPIVCVTPIYSIKEATEPEYVKKSENLRQLMRQAAIDRQKNGDKLIFFVEGLELFGAGDKNFFNDPLHPNDEGNERIAERLASKLSKVPITSKKNKKASTKRP